ncbi:MAG: radical SAM protein [Deltaproteobacteria bacterium]|nr:radical SAM protein [Deltaproteobacteria bacterium]
MIKYIDRLNIHSILSLSFANGPGRRMVIWLQGCKLGCAGCFNPDTHSTAPRHLMDLNDICKRIHSNANVVEGITISGGEPFQQAEALLKLLQRVRLETSLSILVFSGYTMRQIRNLRPGEELLETIDVLIAGPYVDRLRLRGNLCSSSNQKTHLLTSRYNLADIGETPEAEIQIDAKGYVHITGFQDMIHADLKYIAGSDT